MMSAPGVLLSRPRSEQYSSLMAQGLSKMRRDRENTDFALVAEDDKSVLCHKIIMSIYSPHIRKLLQTDMAEAAKKQMNMDFKLDVVKSIVDYIYTGEISVRSDELMPTIKACHLLGVKEMKQWSVEQVTSVLEPGNVIAWREMANKYKLPQLESQCSTMMLHQFLTIVQQNTFLAMTYDQVHQYLAEVHAYLTGVHAKATEVHENATEVHENATGVLENAMEMQENPEDVPEDAATAEGADFVQDDVLSAVIWWINDNTEARGDHIEALLQQVELNKCSLSTILDLMESHGALIGPNPNVFRHVTRVLKEITDQQTESTSLNHPVATQTYPQDNKMMSDDTEVYDEKKEAASTRPKVNPNAPIPAPPTEKDVQDDKQEDKRKKVYMSNMEEDVVEVIKDMQEMSKGQKSKYKVKLKRNDPDLYERYNIAYNGRLPETEEKEKNEGKETKEPKPEPASEPKPEPASTKPKINQQTPIPAPTEVKEETEETVPVSWEDETNESWVQPTNESIAAAASNESWIEVKKDDVKGYNKSGELPKNHTKIPFSFNSKAEKPINRPRISESSSKDEEDKPKEGLSKSQKKKLKAQGCPIDLNASYPPGHPQYEAAKAARLAAREAKEAEEKQQRHRQYPASYPQGQRSRSGSRSCKPWELQTFKRDDGSIILQEVKGDLFGCPNSAALVVSVSADFHMGKGIDVEFKKRFGGIGQLTSFGAHAGGLAYLNRGGRFIYYLVTKEQYNKKPTMGTLESSLKEMREHCEKNRVVEIAMPTIGCGRDKLEWEDVRDLLVRLFRNTKVEITVYKV